MIPIFIITCDRLVCLKESIASYNAYIKTPFEIVIVDFGSTYQPTIEFLKQLEAQGTKVYWKDKIGVLGEFSRANDCIQDYFTTHPESNYIVTDPDVALDNVKGDVLEVYSFLLEVNPSTCVVGPMLRIDDIPDHYPLKTALVSGIMGLHKQFHSQPKYGITYKGSVLGYITAPIDTTFGMYRAGAPWRQLQNGIRVLAPYQARHLDWYVDPDNMTTDQAYYTAHANPNIAHWGKL